MAKPTPTDLPGALLFDGERPVSTAPTAMTAQRDNEFAFHVFCGEHPNLPAPSSIPRPDAVYVMVSDVDDLGPWLLALGGEIHRGPVFEGVTTWSLHTEIPWIGDRDIKLRVSAPVLADEMVMDYIARSVVAS